MEVIPAIDIRGGRCVRLYQGDYDKETVFSEDPVEVARRWASLGAPRLHVVDLDGARSGVPENIAIVERIASEAGVPVQASGGVRSLGTARRLLASGVSRVAVGTAAVQRPDFVRELCDQLGPDAVVVGVDARDGYVAVNGWTQRSQMTVAELVGRMKEMGARRIMYTDIARDGTLTAPNYDAIRHLAADADLKLIAAGGISSAEHLLKLAQTGIEGAVVGRALYTGAIDLREMLQTLSSRDKR